MEPFQVVLSLLLGFGLGVGFVRDGLRMRRETEQAAVEATPAAPVTPTTATAPTTPATSTTPATGTPDAIEEHRAPPAIWYATSLSSGERIAVGVMSLAAALVGLLFFLSTASGP